MESDDSDINEEDIAFVTRKFKKLSKKVGKSIKKGNNSRAWKNDQDQNSGCFRSGKHDHIVKYCPMQKEEQASEQFRNRGKKPQLSGSANRFTKAMVAAWGESFEEEDSSQDEAEALALMAKSDSDTDSESDETMSHIK